jgi:hypothetical protein
LAILTSGGAKRIFHRFLDPVKLLELSLEGLCGTLTVGKVCSMSLRHFFPLLTMDWEDFFNDIQKTLNLSRVVLRCMVPARG